MISPEELQGTHGMWVWYVPASGDMEKGRVKSWRDDYIFVVYKCDGKWDEYEQYTAAATNPKDLEFIKHELHCRAPLGFICSCLPPNMKVGEVELV